MKMELIVMKKAFMVLVGKKENCGHLALKKVCDLLEVPNPALTTEVKTADLYLFNKAFKEAFDIILVTVRQKLIEMDTEADRKDVNYLINEIKKQDTIVNEVSNIFGTKYRMLGREENALEMKPLIIEKQVLEMCVKKEKEAQKEAEAELKLFFMRKYGMV